MKGKPCRFGYLVWVLASPRGELLACQPYGGSKTFVTDYGLGQGPNVVMSLAEQYNLLPGTKVYVDNLFTSLDLQDHMGKKGLGVTGTMRMNRMIGIPLPTKKEAIHTLKRGETKAVYTTDMMVCVWKDNKPVYMASNVDDIVPYGNCERYSKEKKGYAAVSQPNVVKQYNHNMGGVDLLDNSEKNYAITTRVKKWYWSIYVWFLNVSMIQAWRLYRAHMAEIYRLARVGLKISDAEMKKMRTEEKRIEEIPLLGFIRQVVEHIFKKHSDQTRRRSQSRQSRTSEAVLSDIRFDSGSHLVRFTDRRGVCRFCKNRTQFRCARCDVALHPENCFESFHTNN